MCFSKNNCPVPFDQQPLNEYLSLKESLLFSWSISSNKSFFIGLFILFLFLFIFFGLFLSITIDTKNVINFWLLDIFCSHLVFSLLLIRVYLGWSYVVKRLLSATIFYEESGWYDGQVWIKTSSYLMQDRLIGKYQIIPFMNRIKYTFFVICVNFLLIYIFTSIH